MYKLDNAPGRTAFVNGKEYLFFSGYSYLGMGHVAEFTTLVKEGIDKLGLLHPSARISNTQLEIYDEFEQKLADLTGAEKSVSFSSGYLAGRAVAELFIKDKDVFILESTHPVLKDGQENVTGDIDDLVGVVNASGKNVVTIVSDSVNPLKATIRDYSFLDSLHREKSITCIIDDSHGVGLIGDNSRGISAFLPKLSNLNYIITYSLSKAFHINGGAVSCSSKVAEKLRQSPFYSGSTAIAPSMVYAFKNADELYKKQQDNLRKNIKYFIELTRDVDFVSYHPSLPVFVLTENLDDTFFDQHQIIISSFSYPDPAGNKINRIVLNALHTYKDLEKLASILHQASA